MTGRVIACRNCGIEYDSAVEVACPACPSGMALEAAAGLPQVDPPAASRARAAVESAEKAMFWERKKQAEEAARRRRQRRGASFQIGFGFLVALVGLTFSGKLGVVPIYGQVLQAAPLLVGGGIALLGLVKLFKDG